MRIITVSRQFGSGGRELGKRLADRLGFDYYDKEIIDSLAEDQGLDPDYVRRVLGNHGWQNVQLTFRNSFDRVVLDPGMRTQLLVKEREIISCRTTTPSASMSARIWSPGSAAAWAMR